MKKRVLGILGLAALTLVSMIAPANRVYAKEEENLKIGLSFVSLNFPCLLYTSPSPRDCS